MQLLKFAMKATGLTYVGEVIVFEDTDCAPDIYLACAPIRFLAPTLPLSIQETGGALLLQLTVTVGEVSAGVT